MKNNNVIGPKEAKIYAKNLTEIGDQILKIDDNTFKGRTVIRTAKLTPKVREMGIMHLRVAFSCVEY